MADSCILKSKFYYYTYSAELWCFNVNEKGLLDSLIKRPNCFSTERALHSGFKQIFHNKMTSSFPVEAVLKCVCCQALRRFLPFKVPFQDSDSGHRNLLLSSVVMNIHVQNTLTYNTWLAWKERWCELIKLDVLEAWTSCATLTKKMP